ncbi:DUF2190 family protein [Angustibacter sp. McL0619]|uniref:DUF2190 family protein n=1 Tax=Angustibacter sp. McL0619 TaxID=3415676 RepID=UPI003CF29267
MAKNNKFAYTRSRAIAVPSYCVSGSPVNVGSLVGVCLTGRGVDGNASGEATVALDGAFTVNVITTTTRSVGQPVYIITATGVITTTDNSAANPIFGYCLEAKGSAAADVLVEIAQV